MGNTNNDNKKTDKSSNKKDYNKEQFKEDQKKVSYNSQENLNLNASFVSKIKNNHWHITKMRPNNNLNINNFVNCGYNYGFNEVKNEKEQWGIKEENDYEKIKKEKEKLEDSFNKIKEEKYQLEKAKDQLEKEKDILKKEKDELAINNNKYYFYYNKVKNDYDQVKREKDNLERDKKSWENKNNTWQKYYYDTLKEKNILKNKEKDLEYEKTQLEVQNIRLSQDLLSHQQKLESIDRVNSEILKIKNQRINETMLKMNEEKQKYIEEKREIQLKCENMLKQKEEEFKKKREEYEKQIKEEKRIKEKMEKERLNRQRKRLETDFNRKVEEMKRRKIKDFLEDFEKGANDFIIEDISKYKDEDIISNFIIKLFKSENIKPTIFYHLNLFIDKYKNKMKKIEHLNIILVGPSGAGKSTLINAMLNVNAKESFGAPETQKEKYYSSKEIPFLRLADSKGIEKKQTAGVDQIFKSIQDFIQNQIKTNNPDMFIHCIWYCWYGTRLEESEVQLLKKLSHQYTSETIPIIIVYTNAVFPKEVINAKKYVYEELKLKHDFIEILAKEKELNEGGIIYPFNLDKLKEISIEKAKGAIKSSCYEGLLVNIKNIVNDKIKELMIALKKTNDLEVKKIISNMTTKSEIEDLRNETINIIIKIVYQYFFLSTNVVIIHNKDSSSCKLGDLEYIMSETTKLNIKEFVVEYFKLVVNSYKKRLKILIENYSKILSNEILSFQNDYIRQNNNILDIQWTSTELNILLSNYISDKISKRAELCALKNSFSFITTPLIEKFAEFFSKSYLDIGIKSEEFKKNAKEITKISFEAIEEKIKEYNESKKKESEPAPIKDPPKNKVDDFLNSYLNEPEK